jgi:CHAD domain-containing protein
LDLHLDPGLKAQAAAKYILLELLRTIEANQAGTLADLDSEFLHDFRVAIRRTRSALSQIKGIFPAQALNGFRREFGWLGQITGPTRDLDVYLLKFDDYRDSLPEDVRDELAPLKAFLGDHQRKAQRDLAKTLKSPRYRTLLQEWRGFLMTPDSPCPELPNAQRPIGEVANERIWRVYRRALKEGRAIGPETPAEDLHELRKTCKKLRYLMEFFQSLYPAEEIKKLIKALKMLQENLGDFQDLEVQGAQLKHFSQQMMAESQVSAATLLAMGMLVADLMQRQHQAREDFAARFKGFTAADNRALFKKLFAARPQEVILAP